MIKDTVDSYIQSEIKKSEEKLEIELEIREDKISTQLRCFIMAKNRVNSRSKIWRHNKVG